MGVDTIGPENMGMDTKIDFLSFYWKVWGIYDVVHIAQVAILFLLRNVFNEDTHLILVEDKSEYQNQK